MFQTLDYHADGVEEGHLGFWELDFLHQCHQPIECDWGVRQEVVSVELPLIRNLPELAPSGDPHDLIVERVILVQEMLEDLVDDWLLLFCNLDGDPLRDDDCDAAADDVVAWLLLAGFGY